LTVTLRDAMPDQVRGRLSPVAPTTGAGRVTGDKTHISRNDPMQQPVAGPRQGGEEEAVLRLAAPSPVKLRGATPNQVRGRPSPVAPATGAGRAFGDKTHISRNDPMQLPATKLRPSGAPGGGRRPTRLTSTTASVLRSTTLGGGVGGGPSAGARPAVGARGGAAAVA